MKIAYAPFVIMVLLSLNTVAVSAADLHVQHAHAPVKDKRVVLKLTEGERAMVLEEMRLFLGGVQKITDALSKQDMQAIADAARPLGRKMVTGLPPALHAKLPLEFKQLGASVHGDFDQMAMDAESLKDVSYSLGQLSATLQKCVSCHSMYQIQTSKFNGQH